MSRDPEKLDFGVSGFGVSGFLTTKKLVSWIRDPRSPEEDVVVWDPRHEWRTSGFGVRGSRIRGTCESRHRMFRFPDREIPEKNGSVDSLTIDIRDSGNHET